MIRYLIPEDLIAIAERALQGEQVLIRDPGLPESALARPAAGFLGEEAYPTLAGKAAALLHSLATNHALVDGNKRLAFLATAVFLHINDVELALEEGELFTMVVDVAGGQQRDLATLTEQIAQGTRPRR